MSSIQSAVELIQACRRASLGTLLETDSDADSGSPVPFVTLVTIAAESATEVVLLLSGLARHTKNLAVNPNCSLLITDESDSQSDAMAAARVTLVARASRLTREEDSSVRELFLQVHPSAKMYADFGDFAFYRLSVVEAHLVAGFGRIETLTAEQLGGH